jgi:hypothetical protein
MTPPFSAITAQAELHHQYFLGLQLLVSVKEGADTVFDWMFRLFRRQHEAKFLSSFDKLGLTGQPHTIACAKYHVLSNNMGGVGVEYMEESDTKAWVRFRYPRWMYAGPAICGIPVEASRGFLKGWYAQNGVSLGNPRLGFVCVSEDVTGQFGLCGYFKEYDHELSADQRLVFAPDERPPAFELDQQPTPPDADWSPERLAKANRNYAIDYIRNGLSTLRDTLGADRTEALARHAARLTGLQNYATMAHAVSAIDGGPEDVAAFLSAMMLGMGDICRRDDRTDGSIALVQSGLRICRGIEGQDRDLLLGCWAELWRGAVHAHRRFMELDYTLGDETLIWSVRDRA